MVQIATRNYRENEKETWCSQKYNIHNYTLNLKNDLKCSGTLSSCPTHYGNGVHSLV